MKIGAQIFIANYLAMVFLPSSKLLNDAWFVSIYVAFACMLYEYRDKGTLYRMSFVVAIVRAAYNLAILIGMKEYGGQGTEAILAGTAIIILITWRK